MTGMRQALTAVVEVLSNSRCSGRSRFEIVKRRPERSSSRATVSSFAGLT
jgi:hypothetical protein